MTAFPTTLSARAVAAAEKLRGVGPAVEPTRELAIALNGGYGAKKRNEAETLVYSMLNYLAPEQPTPGFDAA